MDVFLLDGHDGGVSNTVSFALVVSVDRHYTIRTDADWSGPERLIHHAKKGEVVVFCPENLHSPHASIKNLEQHTSQRYSCGSKHG
jgi:hypothetical protein